MLAVLPEAARTGKTLLHRFRELYAEMIDSLMSKDPYLAYHAVAVCSTVLSTSLSGVLLLGSVIQL